MNRVVYFIILILVSAIIIFAFVSTHHSTSPPSQPEFEDILYASYNVTGSGEINVNISSNWRMAAIAVIYNPSLISRGYVAFISHSGAEVINMTLVYKPGYKSPVVNETGLSVSLFGLAGEGKIIYHIEGNSIITIQVRYKE